ncbi:polysaccharide pyruvyl transferase family protein [Methylobacterium radiotolerans]|uniref:polysaccharide pyruvyl transferase family protein n=1 Tax=Methylobacterium radiotolerans TaxID=31998 RepID=UPI001F300E3D|nr:polysaccharide pyruvyl transferase family protein [Methylobacterium radiotolerans]UIY43252.1 polysaccharide pyruvyl transferase family protein [Methylobacterium radiotolerans]
MYLPNGGNLGDALLNIGGYQLLRSLNWAPRVVANYQPDDLIGVRGVVLAGGGNWKEGYYESHVRHLRSFLEAGGKLIVLPSSFDGFISYFSKYASQITLFARERTSLGHLIAVPELKERVFLCPDLAFAVEHPRFQALAERRGDGTLYALRTDVEAKGLCVPPENFDISSLWNGQAWASESACLEPILAASELISQYDIVHTDRLHISILSAMLGRTVVMKPNSYFKNRGVFEYSLSTLPNVTFWEQLGSDSEASEERVDSDTKRNELVEQQLLALAKLRREYFEPEISRLQTVVADLERQRSETLLPEIERLRSEMSRLEGQNERAVAIEQDTPSASNQQFALKAEFDDLTLKYEAACAEIAKLEAISSNRTSADIQDMETQLSAAQRTLCSQAEFIGELQTQLEQIKVANSNLENDYQASLSKGLSLETSLNAALEKLENSEKTRLEILEPEVRRLRKSVESLEAKQDLQQTRSRIMAYADMLRISSREVSTLESKLEAAEALRSTWYVPEIERLSRIVEEYAALKQNWFDPELQARSARIQILTEEYNILQNSLTEEVSRVTQLSTQCLALEQEVGRLCEEKRDWFEPQLASRAARISQLEETVRTYEATKTEWFEPKLTELSERISDLERRNADAESRLRERDLRWWKRVLK